MLSPARFNRWALCTSRSRIASATLPIVEDLQQVAALFRRQAGEPPVVEDQQLRPGDALEQSSMPAVTAGEPQCIEQPWHAIVEHRANRLNLAGESMRDPKNKTARRGKLDTDGAA